MKILFVDTATDGHHTSYLLQLASNKEHSYAAVLPDESPNFPGTVYICPCQRTSEKRTLSKHLRWLAEIYEIAEKEKADIVHFLDCDYFYRFFGCGLGKFKRFRAVATLHWPKEGRIYDISLRCICKKLSRLVVHSAYMANRVREKGNKNVAHIEYPRFGLEKKIDPAEAKKFWGLTPEAPVIAAIGGTRNDKGLDLLLQALHNVKKPFQLLIAGKAEDFDEDFIKENSASYASSVTAALHFLSNEELENALWGADIIAVPYKKIFTGASGPLVEGVWCGKCIVGADHGNLGDTIKRNHLGHTFVSEDAGDLARALDAALSGHFAPDEVYLKYQKALQPELFTKKYFRLYESVKTYRS